MKRSKNIFNSHIVHESLLEEEGVRDFNIQNRSIASNWLVGINPQLYRRYIVSALKLTDLQKQLDQLREEESKESKQSNIFKISKTKKKIDTLQLLQLDDDLPLQKKLKKNQPPSSSDFVVQKMSGGFFSSLLERKCLIREKEFFIESQKNEQQKWIGLNIKHYFLELQDKQKPLNKEQFKQFVWKQGFQQRILLWAPQRKCYCLYGKQEHLKQFQRYFQVENFEVKQLNVFKMLKTQHQQKIVTLFGNKVRFYDHFTKIRKAQKDAQLLKLHNNPLNDNVGRGRHSESKEERESDNSGQMAKSGLLQALAKNDFLKQKQSNNAEVSLINLQDSKGSSKSKSQSQKSKQKQKDKKLDSQIFKLKLKTSTVFYNQIQDPLDFNRKEKEDFNIGDINLNLKDDIGCSEVDEESNSHSVDDEPQQSSGKVKKITVSNMFNSSQKFRINIHEVSSNVDKNESLEQDNNRLESQFLLPTPLHKSTDSLQEFLNHQNRQDSGQFKRQNSLKISQIGRKNASRHHRPSSDIDSVIDYFQLEKARPSQDEDSFSSGRSNSGKFKLSRADKQNYLIKNFRKKRLNELEVVLNSREEEIYYAITSIQMMMPFHSQTINFQIIQLDPQLQIQKKIVASSFIEASFKQNSNASRHMLYSIQGNLFFKMSKSSPFFVFVLQQQAKCYYINFEMDPTPKYQRNNSQFLMTQLDKEGYPFAINLSLYSSPQPILIPEELSTVQFMKKYLQEQDYNFKHDFIENKRRRHQIRRKWNILQSKRIVRDQDAQSFAKAIFLGVSSNISSKLKEKVNFNPKKLFKFSQNEARLIEQNVLTNLYEIKSFTKPCLFVNQITKAPFNKYFKERLQQVYYYFLNRYGSTLNLALVWIKAIIDKLEPILLLCRKEQQILAIINLYSEVEYEIDELFTQIGKHFKK